MLVGEVQRPLHLHSIFDFEFPRAFSVLGLSDIENLSALCISIEFILAAGFTVLDSQPLLSDSLCANIARYKFELLGCLCLTSEFCMLRYSTSKFAKMIIELILSQVRSLLISVWSA